MTELQRLIADEVLILLRERRVTRQVTIGPETSLVEDLGLDCLAFVDLTLRLEARLGVEEMPLRDWIDAEGNRRGRKYTLTALSDYASSILSDRSEPSRGGSGATL